jgi:tRNA pseudouridine38-40 synthase
MKATSSDLVTYNEDAAEVESTNGIGAAAGHRNIKLILAYDGTGFCGWQRQEARRDTDPKKRTRTVQGTLEDALEKIHKRPVTLTGSGRTDTGVHAAAQAANFYTFIRSMEAGRFVPALNSLLPRDVRILEAVEIHDDFHARFDARLRTYRYYFITRREALPWELRYAWRLGRQPDIAKLNELARLFRGEMDFTAFAVPGDKSRSRCRFVSSSSFFVEGGRLVFEISANAFLWKMVRSIAGTLLRWEEKGLTPGDLREVIQSRNRTLTGPTAPPQGLFLWKIDY